MPTGIYVRTQQHKDNISKAICGENHPKGMLGKKQMQKAKDKIGKANSGKNNPTWKGALYQKPNKRYYICIQEGQPRMSLARYIAEKCLKRKLITGECVHHINGDKSDDRPENLYVFSSNAEHMRHHRWKITPILISNIIK